MASIFMNSKYKILIERFHSDYIRKMKQFVCKNIEKNIGLIKIGIGMVSVLITLNHFLFILAQVIHKFIGARRLVLFN
jgi:hypothetical protein